MVVTRDGEDTLCAFVSVCRHRGALVPTGPARRGALQCPYHAWTDGLDGALRAAPRSDLEPSTTARSNHPSFVDTVDERALRLETGGDAPQPVRAGTPARAREPDAVRRPRRARDDQFTSCCRR